MTTRIYYFSGTGNSLWAARVLAEKLGATTLTPMVQALAEGETRPTEDRIGIVCPVYMYKLPHIVVEFLRRLVTPVPVFVVVTMGGDPGNLFMWLRRLFRYQGLQLSTGLPVRMPSNYIPFGGVPEDSRLIPIFETAEACLHQIAGIIERGEANIPLEYSRFRAWIHPGLLYKLGYRFASVSDKNFRVDQTCNGCGICASLCPVDNITMTGNRPTWNNRCQQCMACLQWCPCEAIQVGDKTRGERRYHHPTVKLKDILAQKGNGAAQSGTRQYDDG